MSETLRKALEDMVVELERDGTAYWNNEDVAKWIRSLLAAHPPAEAWISVKDPPAVEGDYLGWVRAGHGPYSLGPGPRVEYWDGTEWTNTSITHWMPLPSPPRQPAPSAPQPPRTGYIHPAPVDPEPAPEPNETHPPARCACGWVETEHQHEHAWSGPNCGPVVEDRGGGKSLEEGGSTPVKHSGEDF